MDPDVLASQKICRRIGLEPQRDSSAGRLKDKKVTAGMLEVLMEDYQVTLDLNLSGRGNHP
jgi:hypothetical protein